MNRRYIVFTLYVCLLIHIGVALNCFSCEDSCSPRLTVTCSNNETCYKIEKQLGGKKAKFKGCLARDMCNTTVVGSVRQCCDTDLCNSGTIPHVASIFFFGPVAMTSFCLF
ncbi:hypothetical protein GDO81_003093 [Engystomops pustulosus]|uniref:Uncharacterized protein n=1 Tax=Engystomops pustulosus TaxID=76066 RepID=A0AAV6ZZ38_ENGPU|nr:hypothetical protein GDO81_003093 [Engystomops pustulosus]